ncbi:MAG: GNAT family N-acetyltransferase [Nocardioides sp.]
MPPRLLRPPVAADLPGLYRVCLETGHPGEDLADGRNPELLGHVYAGPYAVADPALCTAVVDPLGVAGYLLATADTAAFEAWTERSWWPALREQYPVGGSEHPSDAATIALLHAPPTSPVELLDSHPAHLHIDLLDRVQGTGLGRTLVDDLCARLAERRVRGVHLGVSTDNAHAIGFYAHLGFTEALRTPDTAWMVRSW